MRFRGGRIENERKSKGERFVTCTICKDDRREEIDAALLSSTPAPVIAKKFGFKRRDALARHRRNCLGGHVLYLDNQRRATRTRVKEVLAPVKNNRVTLEPGALETPDDVLGAARRLHHELEEIAAEARELGDTKTALFAMRSTLGVLEFFGRALKMFDEGTRIDQSTKIVQFLGTMSDNELRAIIERQAS